MDRRQFLTLSALGVTAVSGIGCGTPEARAPALPPLDYDLFIQTLDRDMASMENPLSTVLKSMIGDPSRVPAEKRRFAEDAYKRQLRWMMLLGTVRELPVEAQAHPAIQQRLHVGVAEIDEGLSAITDYFEKLPEHERRAIQERLRAQPDMPMRMAEALDGDCAKLGIAMERRLELRQLTARVSSHLRAQPLSTFIDENVVKLRKIAARQIEERQAQILAEPEEKMRKSSSGTVLTVGGILLGSGAVLGVLGLAVGGIGGAFLLTPAVLLGVGGLITLLVGAIMSAVGD